MNSTQIRWLKPDVRCPNCGAPPAYRISEADRDAYCEHAPETVLRSYQCPVVWCQTIYYIRAKHIQEAE